MAERVPAGVGPSGTLTRTVAKWSEQIERRLRRFANPTRLLLWRGSAGAGRLDIRLLLKIRSDWFAAPCRQSLAPAETLDQPVSHLVIPYLFDFRDGELLPRLRPRQCKSITTPPEDVRRGYKLLRLFARSRSQY